MRDARRRFLLLIFIQAVATACAVKVFVPPSGPGVPAPEAGAAWIEATTACRDVKDATGTLHATFRQGRGSLGRDISFIVTADGRVRLEDSNGFLLAGTATQAQLLLRQDNRIVTAPADDIVDAFIGVRLGPERLLAVLSGCVTAAVSSARPAAAVRRGKQIDVPVSDGRVFLEQRDNHWRAWAGEGDGLVVDYRSYAAVWPSGWRAASRCTATPPIVMEATVNDLEMNTAPSDPRAFSVVAGSATAMTLDQLRTSGPLRGRGC